LVKLADGRWARFEQCRVLNACASGPRLLAAVELGEHHQRLLIQAERAFEHYRARGIPVCMRLDANNVSFLAAL
jgi:hypothetical protein